MRLATGLLFAAVLIVGETAARGAIYPGSPVYSATFQDAVTGDNQYTMGGKKYWTIDSGADDYNNEVYERPTTQTFEVRGTGVNQKFSAKEYYGNLDIVEAKAGVDNQYLYISIDLYSTRHHTESSWDEQGLKYQYDFLLSSKAADGAHGYWFSLLEGTPLGTTYQLQRNQGQFDTNGDVGGSGTVNGLSITKQANLKAAEGNGYETDVIDDGRLKSNGKAVLFSRLKPGDNSIIEFALDYTALKFTRSEIENLAYLDFRAVKGGPKDPQNYQWNDEYTKNEAGSPYRATSGDKSKSEFGTQGLGNLYELDNLRGGGFPPPLEGPTPVPEPASGLIFAGLAALFAVRSRFARR